MSTFSRFTSPVIFAISLFALGCSESDKAVNELPPEVETLEFPYIKNGTLYEFFPESGESAPVTAFFTEEGDRRLPQFVDESDPDARTVSSPEGHIVYLDIDQATEQSTDDEGTELSHSILPELVVYSKGAALFLFELDTRHSHPLLSFENEDGSASQVCDLRGSVTLDEESRLIGQILYKNLTQVYVETAPSDCIEGPFEYHKVDLRQDEEDEYQVRRNVLLTHIHVHKHEHIHDDDHNHDHAFNPGEIDDNGQPFNEFNHDHNHEHDHELRYGNLEEHQFLSKAEIDEVHSLPQNLEVNFEDHNIWNARATKSSEELMYAGNPILNEDTKEFGYLTFDSNNNQYKFYTNVEESFFKDLQYTFDLSDLKLPPLFGPHSRRYARDNWFQYIGNSIHFYHSNQLIRLPILAVFDDDQIEERTKRFEEPVHSFEAEGNNDTQYIYRSETDTLYLRDLEEIIVIKDASDDEIATTLATYSNELAEDVLIYGTSSALLVRKFFEEGNLQFNHEQSAMVSLEGQPVYERTLYPDSTDYISLQYGSDDNLLIHGELTDSGNPSAQILNTNLNESFLSPLENSIWARINNMTDPDTREPIYHAIVNSEDTAELSINERPIVALKNANIYTYDSSHQQGHGTLMGTVPGELAEVIDITLRSDYFGEVRIKDSYEPDALIKTYFFPNGLSFINPTGSFGDMKFMYNNSLPEDDSLETELPFEDPEGENTDEETGQENNDQDEVADEESEQGNPEAGDTENETVDEETTNEETVSDGNETEDAEAAPSDDMP